MVDFTWTSYSRVYMIIKNEVKFILAEDNLNLIIITTPSLQLQITIDALTTGHMHSLPSNIYRIEGRMSSAMYRTPNLKIIVVRIKSASFTILTFKHM